MALCSTADVEFDEARFEELAEESMDDGVWRVARDLIIKDVAKIARARREALAAEASQLERNIRQPISICLQELILTIDTVVESGLTPLILDDSHSHNVDTFFRYTPTSILDAKKCGLDVALKKKSKEESLESARQALVHAMKRGLTLVVSMQQGSPPFSLWLNHPDFFPAVEVFTRSGKALVEDERWARQVFREEDTADTQGFAIPHKDFRVVVTSWFGTPVDARKYHFAENRAFSGVTGLHECLFQVIVIKNDVDSPFSSAAEFGVPGASRVCETRSHPAGDHER